MLKCHSVFSITHVSVFTLPTWMKISFLQSEQKRFHEIIVSSSASMSRPLCLFEFFDMVLKYVSLEALWSWTAAFACVVDNGNKGTRQKKHCSLPLIITVQLSNAYLLSQTVCIMSVRLSLAHCRFVNL